SFRPASMRPVSEYLKLQGRFAHLHAEHIANLQKFANEQWRMMGVQLPEALLKAADARNLTDMAAAAEAQQVAQTVRQLQRHQTRLRQPKRSLLRTPLLL